MPSTLTPPTTVPISAAAAVNMAVRTRLVPEPKLLTGELTGNLASDIVDLPWSNPAPPIFNPTRYIATAFPATADPREVPRLAEFNRGCAAITRRGSAGPRRQRRDRKR